MRPPISAESARAAKPAKSFHRRASVALAALSASFALACSSAPRGPVAPVRSTSSTSGALAGTADEATWMTLAAARARMRIPPGWTYRADGTAVTAEPKDKTAVLVFDAAQSRAEVEARARALGARYGLDRIELAKPRSIRLNGIDAVVFEDMAGESHGDAGDVLILLGEAPSGTGVVMLFLWASDRTQAHDVELIGAANSLRAVDP